MSLPLAPVDAAEPNPSGGFLSKAAKAAQLMEDYRKVRPANLQKSLSILLEAESLMPTKYWRGYEIRQDIISAEEELSRNTDLPGVDEKMRADYRADLLKRLKSTASDGELDSRSKIDALAKLADQEMRMGFLDDADTHWRDALVAGWKVRYGPSAPYNSTVDFTVNALSKAGRNKQAESLLLFIEEQYKAKSVNAVNFEDRNFFIARQYAMRFRFLADTNRIEDATRLLSEILDDNFRYAKDELSRFFLFHCLNDTFRNFAQTGSNEIRQNALVWAKQLLAWQLKHYDADDYRVCKTNVEIGGLYDRNGEAMQAALAYSDALNSCIKYGVSFHEYSQPLRGLERMATALNQNAGETNSGVSVLNTTLVTARSDFTRIEKLSEPRSVPGVQLIARFEELEKLAPYSRAASDCIVSLSEYYEKNGRWAEIPPLVDAAVQYQLHTSPQFQIGCLPSEPWSSKTQTLILLGVRAILKTSTPTAATAFLKKQIDTLKDMSGISEYSKYAHAAELTGDRSLALSLSNEVLSRCELLSDTFIVERKTIPMLERLKGDVEIARAKEIVARIRNREVQRSATAQLETELRRRRGFYPATVSKNPYAFNYAALTSEALTVGPDARISTYRVPGHPSIESFAGSMGSLQSTLPVMESGQLKFTYQGYPGTLGPPSSLLLDNDFKPELVGTRYFYGPPPVLHMPFAPPPSAPFGAKLIADISQPQTLPPGAYRSEAGVVNSLDVVENGCVKLFLSDSNKSQSGLTIKKGGWINGPGVDRPFDEHGDKLLPYQCEIWYGGKKPIQLDEGAVVCGTLYAPQADVVLEDGAQIYGAVVARTITLKGRSGIRYLRR